jgi:hypothetical protein
MSSFKKYGGLNYAATNNIVRNHYSAVNNNSVTNTIGEPNSKTVIAGHIDLSSNSLLNIGSIYFMDGTVQNTAPVTGNNNATIELLIQEIKSLQLRVQTLETTVGKM